MCDNRILGEGIFMTDAAAHRRRSHGSEPHRARPAIGDSRQVAHGICGLLSPSQERPVCRLMICISDSASTNELLNQIFALSEYTR